LPEGWSDLTFAPGVGDPEGERALVLAPPGSADLPLVVALHGRGETEGGLEVGAGAWLRSYGLDVNHRRLLAPPLSASDLHNISLPTRLAAINASLASAPYRGVVAACPWCPDLEDPTPRGAAGFARFVCDDLVPRVRALAGSRVDRTKTGIDGVSMGGRLALLVGLSHPEVFGVVGAMQPALRAEDADMVSGLARAAMAKAPVRLRLLTSDHDHFLEPVQVVSDRLRGFGVPHELVVVAGYHGYEWNRGPGGVEMLLWHDRLAQGLAPV
jgi:hypothetical protein